MARLAARVVVQAVRDLCALGLSPAEASAFESYLVAQRLRAGDRAATIATVHAAVVELFVLLPDHPQGRIRPFLRRTGPGVPPAPAWRTVEGSGRTTVWNVASRGPRTLAARLFQDDDIRNGLRPNAATVLIAEVDNRLPAGPLAAFLLRDRNFAEDPSWEEMMDVLEAEYGLEPDDFRTLTDRHTDLGDRPFGPPGWEAQLLPEDLRPPASAVAATRGSAASVPSGPLSIDQRVRRMVRLAILSAPAVILVGPPGTGKTALLREIIDEIGQDPVGFGFERPELPLPIWVTPEESWTTTDLVGGPTIDEKQRIRFRPGWILEAIRQDRWLVLDEANRADMDKIFGGVLTWLSDQQVELGRSSTDVDAEAVVLGWNDGAESRTENLEQLAADMPGTDTIRILAGQEWRLLGTYNAQDAQRVFRFGQAIGRRFVRVPIPAAHPDQFRDALTRDMATFPADYRVQVTSVVVSLYAGHYASEATRLGPALFLRMPSYVLAGLDGGGVASSDDNQEVPNDQPGPAEVGLYHVARLLTEAYLVNVGTWLSRLPEEELSPRLHDRIVPAPLSQSEWEWLVALLPDLG